MWRKKQRTLRKVLSGHGNRGIEFHTRIIILSSPPCHSLFTFHFQHSLKLLSPFTGSPQQQQQQLNKTNINNNNNNNKYYYLLLLLNYHLLKIKKKKEKFMERKRERKKKAREVMALCSPLHK